MAKTLLPDWSVKDRRSFRFETLTMWLVSIVSVIAVVISFFALQWCGEQFMDPRVAWLLPLAVDGFAVACSAGIVKSQMTPEEGWRDRVNEWAGLFLALGLSVAGNVTHALHEGTGQLPVGLLAAFAASVPVIVAYSIHVLGRAIGNAHSLSARMGVDAPEHVQMVAAPVARPARTTSRVEVPRVERVDPAAPAHQAVAEARATEAPTRARAGSAATEDAYQEYARMCDDVGRDAAEVVWDGAKIAEACTMTTAGAGRNARIRWRARYAAERGIVAEAVEPAPQALDDRETTAA